MDLGSVYQNGANMRYSQNVAFGDYARPAGGPPPAARFARPQTPLLAPLAT